MKLYMFIFFVISSWLIQAADKTHTAIDMPESIWSCSYTTLHLNGKITKSYHLKNGPMPLPLDIQALAWLATTPCCCCSRAIKKHVTLFKQQQHYEIYEPDTGITKRYYPYIKG